MGRQGGRTSALNIGQGSQTMGLIDPLHIIVPGEGGIDWSQWFDHFWQAKGQTYAQSLLDMVSAQNLTEGNGVVPHNALTGWEFVAGNAQWLDTGLVPANDQSWSMLIQFDPGAGNGSNCLGGSDDGAGRAFYLFIDNVAADRRFYANGVQLIVDDVVVAANQGVAGNQGYWDGLADGALAAWAGAAASNVWIGCRNSGGVPLNFVTADIIAVGIKKGPALTAPQVAAAAAAMAAI